MRLNLFSHPLTLRQAAPPCHEQGGRLCDFSHRVEINALVEAMDIIGLWPVDQRRDARIQAKEAIIGRSGRSPILQRRTKNCLMCFGKNLPDLLMVLEHERLGLE